MRRFAAALLLSVTPAIPSFGMPGPIPESHPVQPLDIQSRDVFAETELYCLTLAIYFEGGSTHEPEIGQRHIARVITERARADRPIWGGNTICGVVFYKRSKTCQFSFACLPLARRTPKKNQLWYQSEAIARDALAGRDNETDETIRYYMNAELSALKNACAFRKEFVPVVRAGRHEFFREATTQERAELAKTNPEACKRYAESLKAKKRTKKKKAMHARSQQKKKAIGARTARR
jgi:hypothetical protein